MDDCDALYRSGTVRMLHPATRHPLDHTRKTEVFALTLHSKPL
jgi:hypothetical protein